VAATLALLFIPMIFEFSGGSLGRVALLASMLIPPMLGIGWVQYREHLPVRVPRRRR
jgi:hypothetical protein